MEKILIALSTFAEYGEKPIRLLENSGIEFVINQLKRRLKEDEIIELAKDSTGIVAGVEPYNEYVLSKLNKLKYISRCGVGIDNIDLGYAKNKNIIISNTPEVVIRPVVELVLGMTFDLLRRLSVHTALLKSNHWEKHVGNLLSGKTVGIIGLGRIGKSLALTLKKLDAVVVAFDISPDYKWAKTNGIELLSFDDLLKQSDIISIHVNSKERLLSEREFSLIKNGACLINTSRGHLVDEDALYLSLKIGKLSGAALDVFSEEPYSGKLTLLNNVVLTPHIATLTKESRLEMETEAVKNLLDCYARQ